jgi:hypothetical protein
LVLFGHLIGADPNRLGAKGRNRTGVITEVPTRHGAPINHRSRAEKETNRADEQMT